MSRTPAPWKWFDYPDGRKLLAATDHAVIHCPDAPMACDSDDMALIAAAPELLDVAKAIDVFQREYQTNTYDTLPGNDFYASKLMAVVMAARAAIAKAEAR